MSALTIVQSAATQVIGQAPVTLFSTTDQTWLEWRTLLNVVAEDVAKAYDWPALLKQATITGNGVNETFPLPADYDRMPIKSNLYSTRSMMPLARARDLDHWLEFEITPIVGYPGFWIIIGSDINIKPPLNVSETVKYYYLTKNAWAGNKSAATTDADTYILPERLLTLALIWRYRQTKRLEYGEDMQNYQIALNEEIGRAKGSRVIAVGRARISYDVDIAYPGQIAP